MPLSDQWEFLQSTYSLPLDGNEEPPLASSGIVIEEDEIEETDLEEEHDSAPAPASQQNDESRFVNVPQRSQRLAEKASFANTNETSVTLTLWLLG